MVPTKVKKENDENTSQALLKVSKSWQNRRAERLCWVCIDVQPQWMCSLMLQLFIVIQSLVVFNSKIPMIRDKTLTLKKFKVTVNKTMCYPLRRDLQSMRQKGKVKVSSSSSELKQLLLSSSSNITDKQVMYKSGKLPGLCPYASTQVNLHHTLNKIIYNKSRANFCKI